MLQSELNQPIAVLYKSHRQHFCTVHRSWLHLSAKRFLVLFLQCGDGSPPLAEVPAACPSRPLPRHPTRQQPPSRPLPAPAPAASQAPQVCQLKAHVFKKGRAYVLCMPARTCVRVSGCGCVPPPTSNTALYLQLLQGKRFELKGGLTWHARSLRPVLSFLRCICHGSAMSCCIPCRRSGLCGAGIDGDLTAQGAAGQQQQAGGAVPLRQEVSFAGSYPVGNHGKLFYSLSAW